MSSKLIVDFPYGVRWVDEYGHLHRTDGPAVEYVSGHKEWWVHGVPHRIDGPAVEKSDGSVEFWLFGQRVCKLEVVQHRFLDIAEEIQL